MECKLLGLLLLALISPGCMRVEPGAVKVNITLESVDVAGVVCSSETGGE